MENQDTKELVKMSSKDLPSSVEEEETDIEEIDQGQILSQTRDQKRRRESRNPPNAIEKKPNKQNTGFQRD